MLHRVPLPAAAREPDPEPVRVDGGRQRAGHCHGAGQNRQEGSGTVDTKYSGINGFCQTEIIS